MYTRFVKTTFPGCPQLSATAGALVTLLDAFLVTGFGSVTASALSVASEVATLTVSTGHGWANFEGLGPVVEVSGSSEAALNKITRATVTSATQMTFPAPGVGDGSYLGSATVKNASLGWAIEFTDTNKRVYRPAVGNRHRLYVDDTNATHAIVALRVSSLSIDDASEQAPPTAVTLYYWPKPVSGTTALIGNDTLFFYLPARVVYCSPCWYGDFPSYLSADDYNSGIAGKYGSSISYPQTPWLVNPAALSALAKGVFVARGEDQLTAAAVQHHKLALTDNQFGAGPYTLGYYRLASANGIPGGHKLFGPLPLVSNASGCLRGHIPGCYQYLGQYSDISDLSIVAGSGDFSGRIFLASQFLGGDATAYDGLVFFEISDWS